LEAHRINSDYILSGKDTTLSLALKSKFDKAGPLNNRDLANFLFGIDPNSLLHGVFLEKIAGRLRLPRLISGFIEGTDVNVAESGGVKNNRVDPTLKDGKGNIPFHRTEFTAREVKAFFNMDLALLRGYGLGDDASNLLLSLALFKIRRFLSAGLRLRTACDLQVVGELTVTRPGGFSVPGESDLLNECTRLIGACKSMFPADPVTEVKWVEVKKSTSAKEEEQTGDDS
jgi:CRISPR-associated protein Csb1